MSKKTPKDTLDQLVSDTRESFDLGDFLRGRSVRTKTVRVFTDEVTAEHRGGFEQTTRVLPNGMTVPDIRSWGLVKEIAEAETEYAKLESKTSKIAKSLKAKIDSLHAEVRSDTEKLLESALEIELRAVPDRIKKDAWRAAKKALGINGKVSEAQLLDFNDEHSAQTLVRTVVSITKHATGEKNEGITAEGARNLRGLLPDSEWDKINNAVNELLFEKVIADQVVADQDF